MALAPRKSVLVPGPTGVDGTDGTDGAEGKEGPAGKDGAEGRLVPLDLQVRPLRLLPRKPPKHPLRTG